MIGPEGISETETVDPRIPGRRTVHSRIPIAAGRTVHTGQRRSCALAGALLLAGCAGRSAAPPQREPVPVQAEASLVEAQASAPLQPSSREPAEPPEAPRPVQIEYDLTAESHRAERFVGDTLVVRFDEAGGAKYTLGGWHSGWRPTAGDADAGVSSAGRGRLYLRHEGHEGELVLALEGRQSRRGQIRVYVNGEELGRVALPQEGWGQAELPIPAGTFGPGENEVQLRAPGTVRIPGEGLVGLTLRSLTLGPERVEVSSQDSPLSLPVQGRLRYHIPIPENAEFRSVIRGGPASLRIDGTTVAEWQASSQPTPITVDLRAFPGVHRLSLEASSGCTFTGPAIVTEQTRESSAAQAPQNVLIVLVDTLRADKLSPYDPESRVRTPGLLSFVEDATTFDHAHTQENWTKPSVATLLSSLMPWEHTATQHESRVPQSVQLLPEVLEDAGYYTGSFIANGYVSDRFGFDQGWATYRNYIREGRRTPVQYVAADVLNWLDERPSEKPFFLYVHTIDPHVPYRPPREFLELYGDPDYRGPVNFRRDATLLENIKLGRVRLRERDRQHLVALYDGEISYHDVHFRAILDGLERRGLSENTMVVVTSDHGEELFDHGSVGHGHSVYEELLHIPLFVRLPGQPTLRRVNTPVGLVDIMPTILEALGIDAPAELSGRSFLRALQGRGQQRHRGTISAFMENWRTYTVGTWKLIQRPGNRSRLYDLATDPREQHDIAAERPDMVHWLRGELGLRMAETQAQRPQRRRRHRAQSTEIDEETAAQLRALGYLGN